MRIANDDQTHAPVRFVRTPLPSERKRQKAAETSVEKHQPVRALNEDDDGYDPYSDFHDAPCPEPLFERNPWD